MEGVESALLAGVEGPGLVTIQQRAEYAGLVHFHLSADGQHLVLLLLFQFVFFSSKSRERLLEPT